MTIEQIQNLTIGSEFEGKKIKSIIARSSKGIIAAMEDGSISTTIFDKDITEALSEASSINNQITFDFGSKATEGNRIVKQLYQIAFQQGKDAMKSFSEKLISKLENKRKIQIKVKYLLNCLLIGMVIILITFGLKILKTINTDNNILDIQLLNTIIFGVLGGLTSLYINLRKVKIELIEDDADRLVNAIYRIVMAISFAIVGVVLVKTEIILPSIKNNETSMFLVAFISGFSESFVPNIINDITNKKNQEKT